MASKRPIHEMSNGFILLEVLVAMSLVLSSWLALTHSYQAMVLQFAQSQEKRVIARKAADQFETHVYQATKSQQEVVIEPTRVPSRLRAEPHLDQSPHKNQRRVRGKTN
jgi:Tfp pilus assembly protein PilV